MEKIAAKAVTEGDAAGSSDSQRKGLPLPDGNQAPSSLFPATDWPSIAQADADDARLDALVRQYWNPLKVYLLHSFPSLTNEAEIILLEFAEDRMIRRGWLPRAKASRGRFRGFLKTSLHNYVLDRLKRREEREPPVSLETMERELPDAAPAEEVFDQAWARAVLDRTLERMKADCNSSENPRRGHAWEMFCVRILEPILEGVAPVPYERLVERFGLKSPIDGGNMLQTAKGIFKTHLERVIAEYEHSDAATAAEIKDLEAFLSRLDR